MQTCTQVIWTLCLLFMVLWVFLQEEVVKVCDSYPLLCGVSSEWKQLDDLTKLNPLHEAAGKIVYKYYMVGGKIWHNISPEVLISIVSLSVPRGISMP